MSGPVQPTDTDLEHGPLARVEVREGRSTSIGPTSITRILPTKGRRTVGPWCFVDLIIPPDLENPDRLEIGPHPHIGLATVTWLFEGEVLHGDSLGTEQLIRPGELNLMTSGHGIAHSEEGRTPGVNGVQMWLAQPEETRHGQSRFEHVGELPVVGLAGAELTLLAGSLGSARSPVVVDSRLIGSDIRMTGNRFELPAEPEFEYAIVPVDKMVKVGETIIEPGWLGLVPAGSESLPFETESDGAHLLVLGGVPVAERIQMWWNFVARSREEITEAWRAWKAHDTDRFGPVPSTLPAMEAPTPPWLQPE